MSRLGSVANDAISPRFAHVTGALWCGLGVCFVSLLAAALTFATDRRAEAFLRTRRRSRSRASCGSLGASFGHAGDIVGTSANDETAIVVRNEEDEDEDEDEEKK